MERYICIHGHFYQPPRENPWLGAVEREDSASPFHDWNARISAECYAPNGAFRISDDADRIEKIVNNYARISFNFGPTLLAWMEREEPATYRGVLQADRASQHLHHGHGSALAQAYNHLIMPLANHRDRTTQVVWGIRDFEHRFGRKPEGMWLPETAVDLEMLEILAAHDIRFTLLAPSQARRVRPKGDPHWRDVSGSRIDPTLAYEARLPSGRSIAVFFYDGPVSHSVAFEGVLRSGEAFAERLLDIFVETRDRPQLAHIATDGETFGHHHRFGAIALAQAIRHLESRGDVQLTNYAAFLERHPPTHRVEIFEESSWSCVHGVDRWHRDCGCNSGGNPSWNQAWRAPMRTALDWLRDRVAPIYEQRAASLFADPWAARDDYVEVLLGSRPETRDRFLGRHALRDLTDGERTEAWRLLELQRCAMLMYTSCGWFFDDISSIESAQVLRYASRCVHLVGEVAGEDLEPELLERLARAPSNLPDFANGRGVYLRCVKPAMVNRHRVAAHTGVDR